MIGLQRDSRNVLRARRILGMLERLREGTVIAEGMHDVKVLKLLGIDALTYPRFAAKVRSLEADRFYILTDGDRGGDDKRRKITSMLLESHPGCIIDESLGRHMLRMLNVTSVEQIHGPVEELLVRGKQKIEG